MSRNSKSRRRRRRRRVNVFLLLIIIVLGAAVFATVYATSVLSKINREPLSTNELDQSEVPGYINILLLGVDTRDMDTTEGSRSDAIMIASINEETGAIKLTSIYRDTYLEMGDTGDFDKITHAHYYGGPEMSIKSVNRALDIDIDSYVLFNFKTVADAVDAMGGIEVTVEDYEIEELNKYTKESAHAIGRDDYNLIEEPGDYVLDGAQAVSYGRIRKGVGDDYKRTDRMREVFSKMIDKAKEMGPMELIRFANVIAPEIKTNLDNREIAELAILARHMKVKSSKGFPYNKTSDLIGGVSYVLAENLGQDVIEFHQEVFGEENYELSQTAINISYTASYY